MDKLRYTLEKGPGALSSRNRKFGDRVIRSVLEGGVSEVVVNPMFFGLAYRDESVYSYIQAELAAKGIETHIAQDLIESGSEAKIPRHTLIVDSRLES